jgi:hypothetical protein
MPSRWSDPIIMDEEDAIAAENAKLRKDVDRLLITCASLRHKLDKYEMKERMKQADQADKNRGGYRRRTPRVI